MSKVLATKKKGHPPTDNILPSSSAPIEPSELMGQESLFDLPPVEDEDFVPDNNVQLARAAYALAKMVPPAQIKKFYYKLHNLTYDAISWQSQEDMSMNIHERKLRQQIRKILKETSRYEDLLSDFASEEPDPLPGEPGYDAFQRSVRRARDVIRRGADRKVKNSDWSKIEFKPKTQEKEFWEMPDYKPEPAEPEGGYGHPMRLEKIAGEVEGLNTPSAVRQFLEDPRKINLLDKVSFLINLPEKTRQNVLIGAAADYINKLEQGQVRDFDHNDPGVRKAIHFYIAELEAEGVLEDDDAQVMRSRTEYVASLDSFKKYLVEYFDDNFDDLLRHEPFREHLKKYWDKMMFADPALRSYVEKRKEADIERVRKKKASK